jgi:hypothetical protein
MFAVLAVLLCTVMVWTVPVGAEEPSPVGAETSPVGEADTLPKGEGLEEEGERTGFDMEELKAYINNTVIPAAVMVVTALAALYVALVPVFNKVKETIKKFDKASGEITATAGESELTKKNTKAALDKLSGEYTQLLSQNKELETRYKALEAVVTSELASMKANVSGEMAAVRGMAGDIEKMLLVGFCNNRELVEKGYAKQIARLGAGVKVDVTASGEEASGDEQDTIEGDA